MDTWRIFTSEEAENPRKNFKHRSIFFFNYLLSKIHFPLFSSLVYLFCYILRVAHRMRETRNYIARRLIKSDNFAGNRKKKLNFAAEFIATRRGSGNSFTLAACSFQKQKRIIPPLRPSPMCTCIRAELGKNFFAALSRFAHPRRRVGARLMRCATRPQWFNRPYFAGEIWRNQGNAFMRVYAVRVMNPSCLSKGWRRESVLNSRIRVARRSSVRARSVTLFCV